MSSMSQGVETPVSSTGIAFIVGAYNRPGRLRTCLSSIIDQTYTDFEVVVVDNSDPGAAVMQNREYVEYLNDLRVRYEYVGDRTYDAGVGFKSLYKATDIGVGMTTKPWLALPNCDSYFCPWYAERMLRAAEHCAWDLVYCDIVGGTPAGGHFWLRAEPKLCSIDKTNFLLRREWYAGFPSAPADYPHADGLMIEGLVTKGIRHGRVPQILVFHN
jgi:hypothetical protein